MNLQDRLAAIKSRVSKVEDTVEFRLGYSQLTAKPSCHGMYMYIGQKEFLVSGMPGEEQIFIRDSRKDCKFLLALVEKLIEQRDEYIKFCGQNLLLESGYSGNIHGCNEELNDLIKED